MASSPFGVFGAIEHTTRRELIVDRLRAAVSSGELPPGTHLAEIELSESLGVSRGTLREALRHLQQEGLVVSDTRNRLSVRTIDRREVREIFAVRLALETLACEEICASDDRPAVIAAISNQVDRMSQPGIRFAERVNEDLEFHRLLCIASGNQTLLEAWLNIAGLTRLSITAAGPETALHNMSAERHRPLLALLIDADVAGVREFLRAHMAHAVERIEASLIT
jgi:DNA-binding GntR family transcriptional regulator